MLGKRESRVGTVGGGRSGFLEMAVGGCWVVCE